MQARYLSSDATLAPSAKNPGFRILRAWVFGVIAMLMVATAVFSSATSGAKQVSAEEGDGFDPVRWAMCVWGEDSVPAQMYKVTQSSDLQFQTRSKSTLNFGTDNIDGGLNSILQLFGPNYIEVNKDVIGRVTNAEYEDVLKEEDESFDSENLEFNSGPLVNPFDRFGVAGLKFTGYTGEWKYVVIDACKPETDPVDPKSNLYYEERLEPRSTWEDISKSQDVRTQQFSKGLPVQYGQALGTVLANWVFIIPKAAVVLTTALINFSFADVGEKLGVVDLLVGSDGKEGVFTTLFENLYIPMLAGVMLIMAAWLLSLMFGLKVREAFIGFGRGLLMVLVAFLIAANPGPWINGPNAIAVFFQGSILSTMDRSLESQGELCTTDIGSVTANLKGDSEDEQESLAETSENIRSVVGCTFWHQFLVTPWAEAQWGTDWNNLWVKDNIPEWAPEDAQTLDNTNDEMVGDAAVPLGDGQFIHNWAIFQISTQTDAHSPLGDDGAVPKYSSGMSTDWWRIVDATSNYQEVKVEVEGGAVGSGGSGDSGGSSGEASGEWGGHENGKIPEDELAAVSFDSSHKLREDATTALEEMNEEYKEAMGSDISITDSYRSYEEQVDIAKRKPDLAATPGTSNHGWGLALDLGGGINSWGTPEREWMEQNAERFGWISPEWAQPGNGKEEPWHWEYNGEYSGGSSDDSSGSQNEADQEGAFWKPDPAALPVDEWDTWAGNSAWSRIVGASSAALVAGIGLGAPFVLSLLASSAALGSVIVMAFAPVMLLLGAGPGRLFEAFKAWLKLIVDLTLTRVALGILLVFSIIFTMIAIEMMSDVGWWQGMVLLVLASIIILKSRARFVEILTAMSFAAQDISGGMKRISSGIQTAGRAGVRGATTAVAGGANSKRYGGSFTKGALVGVKNELKNQAYRNSGTRSALATYETMKHNQGKVSTSQKFCARCGADLGNENEGTATIAGRDDDGNYYCKTCLEDGAAPDDTREVLLDNKSAVAQGRHDKADKPRVRARKSAFENDTVTRYRKSIVDDDTLSDEEREQLVKLNAAAIGYEINNYRAALAEDGVAAMPQPPKEIARYLDRGTLEKAWNEQNIEYIEAAYSTAWATWFEDETGQKISSSLTEFITEVSVASERIRNNDTRPAEDRRQFVDEVGDAEDAGKRKSDKG